MTHQIVLAFTPSNRLKDYSFGSDGQWYYQQYVRHYCTLHEDYTSHCPDVSRAVGKEPYYNLATKQIVEPPRVYVKHYLTREDGWEKWKTIDDVRNSKVAA